jgi:hypothetical protein
MFKSDQNKSLYRAVSNDLAVEFCIGYQDTTEIYLSCLKDGIHLLQIDFRNIQEYLEEVIYEFIDKHLSDKGPKTNVSKWDISTAEHPSLRYWGPDPMA